MADFENKMSYSFSRENQSQVCLRQYYWRRYGYWNGWKDVKMTKRKKAWLLKRLSGPPLLLGDVIHNRIATELQAAQRDLDLLEDEGPDSGLSEVEGYIRRGYRQSSQLKFFKDKHAVTFLGDYYDSCRRFIQPLEDIVENARNQYMNWYSSRLRKFLLAHPKRIKSVEVMESTKMHGVDVYTVLDLLAETKTHSCTIFDWKTGKRDDAYNDQLALYAYYLHTVKGYKLSDIKMVNVYTKEGPDVIHKHPTITKRRIEETKKAVKRGIERLASLLEPQGTLEETVKANIPKDIEHFPMVDNPDGQGSPCRFCNYRELCDLEDGAR